MKFFITVIYAIVCIFAAFGWIWPAVEFILYLAKDMPFHWVSVWANVAAYGLIVMSPMIMALTGHEKYALKGKIKNGKSRLEIWAEKAKKQA